MARQAEQDIEYVPGDELVEPEPDDAEDAAVHVREAEEAPDLVTVEAEEIDVTDLGRDVVEELEVEAAATAEAEAEAVEDTAEEEHEEDLEEVLRRHYGIVSTEPEVEPTRRPTGAAEFVCASCYLRKPASQLADPERDICADCAANDA